jgi:hypothetical protein
MMSRADQLRAELELVELEEALVAAKADPDLSVEELRAVKDQVRAARQSYREAREG